MSNEIDRKPILDDNGNIIGWLRTKDRTFEELKKELEEIGGKYETKN